MPKRKAKSASRRNDQAAEDAATLDELTQTRAAGQVYRDVAARQLVKGLVSGKFRPGVSSKAKEYLSDTASYGERQIQAANEGYESWKQEKVDTLHQKKKKR